MYSRNFFRVIGTVIVFLILSQQVSAQLLDKISPHLRNKMNSSSANEQIRIIVLMQEHRSLSDLQALTAGMSRQDKRQTVVAELKGLANATQAALSSYLSGMMSSQKVSDTRQLWAINGIAALATGSVIEEIAKFNEVKRISWDPLVSSEAVQDGAPSCNLLLTLRLIDAPLVI